MTHPRAIGLVVLMCSLAARAYAQDTTPTVGPTEAAPLPPPAVEDLPPPPPTDTSTPTETPMQVPEPPAAYASTTGTTVEGGNATPTATPTTRSTETSDARRRFNLWVGLGIGDAVGCGNEDPDSLCAVDGAFTFTVAGDFRFYPNFSVGLELAFWGYAVNDEWRGQLAGAPDKAEIASFFLAAFGRWYWFDKGIVDPYLQLGLGVGGISGTVSNMTDSYTYAATGVVPHLALGVDFHVHRAVRIGPQFLTALQLGNRVCETIGDEEMCRDPEKNAKGEREGNLLAWRFMLVGTIMLGER